MPQPPRLATLRRRTALFALFFVSGISLSSWVTRTPAIRDLLGASTGEMGLVLFGLSIGSMVGILSSGPLVQRTGTRPVVLAGALSSVVALPIVAGGAAAQSAVVVAVGLFFFGLGMGGAEVAMNIEAAETERLLGRPVMPTMHGFFSFGTVVGALLGMGATAAGFPVVWHLVIAAALALCTLVVAIRAIPSGVGLADAEAASPGAAVPARRPVWRDSRLLLIGAVVLAMALAEGSANDWLPLLMIDGHGYDATWGSAIYAVFSASMTAGRFAGAPLLGRFGRVAVVRASAVTGAVGLALVAFVDDPVVAGVSVVLWGLGAALGFPVAMSAAGDSGPNAAARVSFVATVGYVAFLVGPPVLGFLGDYVGLRLAMLVVLGFVAVAAALAHAVGEVPLGARGPEGEPEG